MGDRRRSSERQTAILNAAAELVDVLGYHKCTIEAVAKRAGVGTLVLTHLIPQPRGEEDKQAFADDARAGGYEGELIVADDGTTVRFG